MYCKFCGTANKKKAKRCIHCDRKLKNKKFLITLLIILTLFSVASFFVYFPIDKMFSKDTDTLIKLQEELPNTNNEVEKAPEKHKEQKKTEIDKNKKIKIIKEAQESVYTVFSEESQGSGFLYNQTGIIITNAHVVEGSINVIVKNKSGQKMPGKVIGYSNETDVAIIKVEDLIGEKPYPLELENSSDVGERVIALGSPLGLENTATVGYLTGVDRHLTIGTFIYENIYQISAPIAPGNSGGALVSVDTQKIIAINSAKSTETDSIGFSIPLYHVKPLIEKWLEFPMDEAAILKEFYDVNGEFYFGENYSTDDGEFDGDNYNEEFEEDIYWYYGEDWYDEEEFNESDYDENWDEYDESGYEDYYDENWDEYEEPDYEEYDDEDWDEYDEPDYEDYDDEDWDEYNESDYEEDLEAYDEYYDYEEDIVGK